MWIKGLTATVFAAAMMASGGVSAAVLSGSSSATFSNLSGCDLSGSNRNCSATSTNIQWGTSGGNSFANSTHSSLTSAGTTFSNLNQPVTIGVASLTWYNAVNDGGNFPSSAGGGPRTPDFSVSWTVTINFTAPDVETSSRTFDLRIINTTNPTGDEIFIIEESDLAALLNAINNDINDGPDAVLATAAYFTVDGGSLYDNVDAPNDGETHKDDFKWKNPERGTSTLTLNVDFVCNANCQKSVPEPMTMGLLGAGLMGLGLTATRRRRIA